MRPGPPCATLAGMKLLHALRHLRARRPAAPAQAQPSLPPPFDRLHVTPTQALWIVRTVLAWHALPSRCSLPIDSPRVALHDVAAWAAERGVTLRLQRVGSVAQLQRGDLVALRGNADAQVPGLVLALVIEAGPERLRLSPALARDPIDCHARDLRGRLAGWVLRGELAPAFASAVSGWDDEFAAA